MTLEITLDPSIESQLRQKATEAGKDVNTLVTELIKQALANDFDSPVAIIRTERGLTIQGTRITLYDVMAYLLSGCGTDEIRTMLPLSKVQLEAAMTYIEAHQAEVVEEYYQVLQQAEESRKYWEAHNHERLAQLAKVKPAQEMTAAQKKLQAWKARLDAQV